MRPVECLLAKTVLILERLCALGERVERALQPVLEILANLANGFCLSTENESGREQERRQCTAGEYHATELVAEDRAGKAANPGCAHKNAEHVRHCEIG